MSAAISQEESGLPRTFSFTWDPSTARVRLEGVNDEESEGRLETQVQDKPAASRRSVPQGTIDVETSARLRRDDCAGMTAPG